MSTVQLRTVFPGPPKEKLRVVPLFGGVVDRAAENVKHTPVDWSALKHTEPLVELLGITARQIRLRARCPGREDLR